MSPFWIFVVPLVTTQLGFAFAGDSCSNSSLTASRTTYQYKSSPGWNVATSYCCYLCYYDVYGSSSTDKVIIMIDSMDVGSGYYVYVIIGSVNYGGGQWIYQDITGNTYNKILSMQFGFYNWQWSTGGWRIKYWSEENVDYSGSQSYTAQHYSKQSDSKSASFTKHLTPLFYGKGKYTYTVSPGTSGNLVVLSVDSSSSNNLSNYTINGAVINSGSVYDGTTLTIEVYWNTLATTAGFSISFTYFATYSVPKRTLCNATETLFASRTEYRYMASPGYGYGWYWHKASETYGTVLCCGIQEALYSCIFTVTKEAQYSSDTVVIRIDDVDTNFTNNSMTVTHSGGSTTIDTSNKTMHYYQYPTLTFQYDGSYFDRIGGFYVAYWTEPTSLNQLEVLTAYHYSKQTVNRAFSCSKVSSPILNTVGNYTYTVIPGANNGDRVVLYVDSQSSSNINSIKVNGANINSGTFYDGNTVTIEVYWSSVQSASFSITFTYFATYSTPQGTPCNANENLIASRTQYRYRSSPGYSLGWYWNTGYSCTFTVTTEPLYSNDTIVIRIDGVDTNLKNNSMSVSHNGGSTSIDISHRTNHYFKYPSLTFVYSGSSDDRYGGFYVAYWSEPEVLYQPESLTAVHYNKTSFHRNFSYAKVSSPYLYTEGRHTFTVSPGAGNGDKVVLLADSHNSSNVTYIKINGAVITNGNVYEGSTVTIEVYWYVKTVTASFSIGFTVFATFSVVQGTPCNGNEILTASRTDYKYRPSPGYALGWYWHLNYSCNFTVTTEAQYSADTVVIRIDGVDTNFYQNSMTVNHNGGSTSINTSHIASHFFKQYPSLTFQFYGSYADRYGGFNVAYWSEPTAFYGPEDFTAKHYSKQTVNRMVSYSKVPTPYLDTMGNYTYKVTPDIGNGDQVVLFVDSHSSSNLSYFRINGSDIGSSSFFQGSTVTIEIYWYLKPVAASFSIGFTYFSTYSVPKGTSCSATENLSASRTVYRYRASPGYGLGWYWHTSYMCVFTVTTETQYLNDTIVIRIDGVDTDFKNNSLTVIHSGGTTSIDTSNRTTHYYKYPTLTFQYDGSYYDRYGGFYVAYWSEPEVLHGPESLTAYHYNKSSFHRNCSYAKVSSPYLDTEGKYTYTVSPDSGNGDQVVLFVDSQNSNNLSYFKINGADINSSYVYQASTITIEVYWYLKLVAASFSIDFHFFATYSTPQRALCNAASDLISSRIEYRNEPSPGYGLGWYWHTSYSYTLNVIVQLPDYLNDTIVIRIDGVDTNYINNSMTVYHSGGSTSIGTNHVTNHYFKYLSLTIQYDGSNYDRYGGFNVTYWSEPTGLYKDENFTAYHYNKTSIHREFSYAKVSSPYLNTEGRYTYTVSPDTGNGDRVVLFVDSYTSSNLSYFRINGADISSSYAFQGSTITIEIYWNLKLVGASFSIDFTYFATYSVPQGFWCNGTYGLTASRTEYRYKASAGYGLGWYWHKYYSCIFTVTTEPQYSNDTIVIRIDAVEPSYINNSMTVYHSGGSTSIDTSRVTKHYYKYPSLTFQCDGSYYDRYGGFYVAYWSEPTEFSGSGSYLAYYNRKQSDDRQFLYHKVPVPFLYTSGNFTYTVSVSSGNGDQVILLAHDRYCNNLTSFTINNYDICDGVYTKFHQGNTITIHIDWYHVYPIHFNITFYYFSTFLVEYVAACSGTTIPLMSIETGVDFIHSPHFPATYFKANTRYNCNYQITAATNNFVGLLVQYSYLEGDDHLTISDGDGALLFHSNGSNSGFVVSTKDNVHVQLTTDDASETLIESVKIDAVNGLNGFIIRYLTVAGNNLSEPDFTLNAVPDDDIFLTTDNNSQISALHPPFSSTYNTYVGHTLYWMIRAPCRSYKNYIEILFLDLDGANDYLTIFNGNKNSSPVLLSYNKARSTYGNLTFSTTTSGQYALVRLSIDILNNDNHGWLLTYRKVEWSTPSWYRITNVTTFPPSNNTESVCNSTGRTLIGYCPWSNHSVTFPSLPNVYDHNLDCEWLLEAEDRYYIIRITFDYFDVENNTYCVYDYLRVYDGVYVVDKDLLNTFCGYNVPPSQQSSGQWMRLKFHSDHSLQYSGFRFTYESLNITEEVCYMAYDSYQNFTATTMAQQFSSTNYPNYYPNNHDKYWMIENPEYGNNATLVVRITSINMEVSEYCKYDRIMIYKGRCTTAKEIYDLRYCGKRPKRYELKYSQYYLIRHHTDYNIVKEGFQIEFYYVTVASWTAVTPTSTTTTAGPPVSRVVQLVDELTNTSFYNNENVPMKDLNIPSRATISFELSSITDLNEKKGKLISVGKFTLQWLDEFLVWEPGKKHKIAYVYIPQDEVWKPSLALINAYSGVQKMGASFMNVHVTYNGTVTWTPKQVLQSSCRVDLTYYPYDEQVCKLQFQLWGMDNSNVNFTVASTGFYTSSEYKDTSKWTLMYSSYSQKILSDRNVFTMSVRLKRNAGSQLYSLMVPVALLAALNAFAFVLPPESEEKARLSILIFCGFLLYNVMQNKEMPKHSTGLSLLAIYNLALLFNSFSICFLSLLILRISHFNNSFPPGKFLSKLAHGVSVLRTVMIFNLASDINPSPNTSWKQVASAIEFVLFWLFSVFCTIMTVYFQARIANNSS